MSSLQSKYKVEVLTKSGLLLADFSGRIDNRTFHISRNRAGDASWNIPLYIYEKYARDSGINASTLIGVAQNDLLISRNGRPLFLGEIEYYDINIGDESYLTARVIGYFDLLANAFTGDLDFYNNVDAGQIAWGYIDNWQNSDANANYGIVEGDIQATVNRDRNVGAGKNIKEGIIQLTEVINGFDFEIDTQKRFNVYPLIGVDRTEFNFTFPGNIKSAMITVDGTQIANLVVARGQGLGDAQLSSEAEDLISQVAYKVRMRQFDYADVSQINTLTQHAEEEVSTRGVPNITLSLTLDGNRYPFVGSYWIGDRVPVFFQGIKLLEPINGIYRIDDITVTIDANDSEDVSLLMSRYE